MDGVDPVNPKRDEVAADAGLADDEQIPTLRQRRRVDRGERAVRKGAGKNAGMGKRIALVDTADVGDGCGRAVDVRLNERYGLAAGSYIARIRRRPKSTAVSERRRRRRRDHRPGL